MQTVVNVLDIYWLISIPLAAIFLAVLKLMYKKPTTKQSAEGTEHDANRQESPTDLPA